jgi:hypothetical protein
VERVACLDLPEVSARIGGHFPPVALLSTNGCTSPNGDTRNLRRDALIEPQRDKPTSGQDCYLALGRRRDEVEGEGQALLVAGERHGAVPHVGWEQRQQSRLGLYEMLGR